MANWPADDLGTGDALSGDTKSPLAARPSLYALFNKVKAMLAAIPAGQKVWTDGNDGQGSGLEPDYDNFFILQGEYPKGAAAVSVAVSARIYFSERVVNVPAGKSLYVWRIRGNPTGTGSLSLYISANAETGSPIITGITMNPRSPSSPGNEAWVGISLVNNTANGTDSLVTVRMGVQNTGGSSDDLAELANCWLSMEIK